MSDHLCQMLVGYALAIVGYLGRYFADIQAVVPPEWWDKSASLVMVGGLSYAVIHLWKALGQEREARIQDRDTVHRELRDSIEKNAQSREALNTSLRDMVKAVADLREQQMAAMTETQRIRLKREDAE